jgi:CDP-diacylglycerol--serine O-phosphatidyltransferase
LRTSRDAPNFLVMSSSNTEPPIPPRKTPRWRYVVPNAITCASLLVGLVAVGQAFIRGEEGGFTNAAWLIVLSVLLDKLDGTAARSLKATSAIGMQLDSFADFVTFGIAPATLLFASGLHKNLAGEPSLWAGETGLWLLGAACATFVLCACIRLAKFNVLQEDLPPDAPKVFYGMPTTFAGGLTAVLFILGDKYGMDAFLEWLPVVAVVLGALMVSNLPLPKLVRRNVLWIDAIQVVSVIGTYICGLFRILPEYLAINIAFFAVAGFGWGIANRKRLLSYKRLDPYPDE